MFLSFNAVVNDKATTAVQSTQQLALWYKGPFDSRPNDSFGFGVANYIVNDRYKNRQLKPIVAVAMTNTTCLRQIMCPFNVMNSMLN